MLIELDIKNFRSIKEKVTLSLLPSGKFQDDRNLTKLKNIGKSENYQLLNSVIIYGGNAAGKSNVLKALTALKYLVAYSVDNKINDAIDYYYPFLLDKETREKPVYLKATFIAKDKVVYEYEIEYNYKKVLNESLYFYPKNQKAKLFDRLDEDISYGEYFKGNKNFQLLENQLLLSHAGKTATESLLPAYQFFSKYIFTLIINDTDSDISKIRTIGKSVADNKKIITDMNRLLKYIGSHIEGIEIKEIEMKDILFPEFIPENTQKDLYEQFKYQIKAKHKVYHNKKEVGFESLDLMEESNGTIKFLSIAGWMLQALQTGSTVLIDELDKSLHPLLTRILVSLFNNPKSNPKGAQLIFTSHDVSLIDKQLLRLDQIWFVEKDMYGETVLYPLSEFTGISKVTTLKEWYMNGRFGGIPEINYPLIEIESCHEEE